MLANVADNNIGDAGAAEIADALKINTTITMMDLRCELECEACVCVCVCVCSGSHRRTRA